MPTGYTAILGERDITFEAFALRCARAFGALMSMRDDALDAPVPESFEPEPYYAKRLAEAEADLRDARDLTIDECARRALAEYTEAQRYYHERLATDRVLRDRYERMKAAALAWVPPTPEHEGLRTFMCEQIDSSIRIDCGNATAPEPLKNGEEWKAARVAQLSRVVAYYAEAERAEVRRTEERTQWVAALRESLATVKS